MMARAKRSSSSRPRAVISSRVNAASEKQFAESGEIRVVVEERIRRDQVLDGSLTGHRAVVSGGHGLGAQLADAENGACCRMPS
jgi:hypothetical protein